MNTTHKSTDLAELGCRAFLHINSPAVVIDREGNIQLLTPEFRCKYVAQAAANPATLGEIFSASSSEIIREVRIAQKGVTIFFARQTSEGTNREGFTVSPIKDGPGRPTHYLLSASDPVALNRGFGALNVELEKANKIASEARLRQRELANVNINLEGFARSAAHDLKAPLRNMRGYLSLLAEEHSAELGEEARGILGKVQTSASRLHQLIEDLLAHSKSSTGKLQLEALSMESIVERVQENLAQSIDEVNARVEIEGPGSDCDDDIKFKGDSVLVHQLLENLIGNSLKYRAKERDPQITIRKVEGNRLEIQDNGLGFDNCFKEKLFEPFERLFTDSEIEGSGVGLATCKMICDRHGWKIDADGEPDKGAKFTICLGEHSV